MFKNSNSIKVELYLSFKTKWYYCELSDKGRYFVHKFDAFHAPPPGPPSTLSTNHHLTAPSTRLFKTGTQLDLSVQKHVLILVHHFLQKI